MNFIFTVLVTTIVAAGSSVSTATYGRFEDRATCERAISNLSSAIKVKTTMTIPSTVTVSQRFECVPLEAKK